MQDVLVDLALQGVSSANSNKYTFNNIKIVLLPLSFSFLQG